MINFPTSPAQGTTITAAGGITWQWNGTKWMMKSAGTDEVSISPTDPGAVGDLWFNSTSDMLYALDAGVWTPIGVPPAKGEYNGNGQDNTGPARGTIALHTIPASSRVNRIAIILATVLCTPITVGETDVDISTGSTVIAKARGGGSAAWTSTPSAIIFVPAAGLSVTVGITPLGTHTTRTSYDPPTNHLHVAVF